MSNEKVTSDINEINGVNEDTEETNTESTEHTEEPQIDQEPTEKSTEKHTNHTEKRTEENATPNDIEGVTLEEPTEHTEHTEDTEHTENPEHALELESQLRLLDFLGVNLEQTRPYFFEVKDRMLDILQSGILDMKQSDMLETAYSMAIISMPEVAKKYALELAKTNQHKEKNKRYKTSPTGIPKPAPVVKNFDEGFLNALKELERK